MVQKENNKKKNSQDRNNENTKRKHSLADTTSPSASSTNSSADSDENAETKSTMTSVDLNNSPSLPKDPNLYRPVCTDIPPNLGETIGFTSLSDQFPLNNTQPLTHNSTNHNHSKSKDKKEREKDRREREREKKMAKKISIERLREMKREEELRKEVVQLLHLNKEKTPADIENPPVNEVKDYNSDKLAATIGFGVAATGIYDKIPEVQGSRSDEASVFPDVTYSEYVGERRINWREEFEEIFATERNQYRRMRADWEFIGAHRRKLRAKVNKLSKNKWIRDFLHLFLDGKIMKVWKRIQIVQKVLREREDDTSYRNIGNTAMLETVIQTVVQMLIEPEEGFNLLMYLTTHSFPECVLNDKIEPAAPACFHRKHGDCMLAELILYSLPPLPQRRLLAHSTITTRMRAMHFAACAGNPCQLDVLLKFNVNPNYIDATGRSPIQYTVIRNHPILARQLMWHGADLTMFDTGRNLKYEPTPERTPTFFHIAERYKALERAMCSWVKAFSTGKWKVLNAVSSLHCTRLALYADSLESFSETKSAKPNVRPRLVSLSLREETYDANLEKNADQLVLVFAIPLMFSPYDAAMPALYPHVFRTKLVIDNDYLGTPAQILTRDPMIRFHSSGFEQTHDLPSIFQEVHNGFVYGWQIPKNIDRRTTPVLSIPLDPSQLSSTMKKHAILFVQAFAVMSTAPKQKSD